MRRVMDGAVIARAMMGMTTATVRRGVARAMKLSLLQMMRTARSEKAPKGAGVDCNGF
jgi:hypothetical protein